MGFEKIIEKRIWNYQRPVPSPVPRTRGLRLPIFFAVMILPLLQHTVAGKTGFFEKAAEMGAQLHIPKKYFNFYQ